MTTVPWHAERAERHVAGAAIATAEGARLVEDLVELNYIYDESLRRIAEHAIAMPPDPDVDLSAFDDEASVLGASLTVRGQAITGRTLRRVVSTAVAVDRPSTWISALVVDLPCSPCGHCVGQADAVISRAAMLRRALTTLRDTERRLLEDPTALDDLQALVGTLA